MVRVQKILANLGLGARRKIEELIVQGKVKLNSKDCVLGDKVSVGDVINLQGRIITLTESDFEPSKPKMLLYHKPVGEVCTRDDEEGRTTVFVNLPQLKNSRWINIGRLDINTSGLLLFTDNGELANEFMHPKSQIEREYLIKLDKPAQSRDILELQKGVMLEGKPAKFKRIKFLDESKSKKLLLVILTEGRNREVRKLWEGQGYMISRLKRIRFGKHKLPRDLLPGEYMDISEE